MDRSSQAGGWGENQEMAADKQIIRNWRFWAGVIMGIAIAVGVYLLLTR